MIKYLLLVFLLVVVKMLPAQVSSMVMASATIVNPVGTEEIAESNAPQSGLLQETLLPGAASITPSVKGGFAKFRVINEALVYAVTVIPYTTEKHSLQKKEQHRLFNLTIQSLAHAEKKDLFSLQAGTETAQLFSSSGLRKSFPDVVIHFN